MKKHYSPFSRFAFRTSLYPMQYLEKWDLFLETPVFREALFLASPEFSESELFIKKNKKAEKRTLSLYKYFSRACTRCTPFGLFAGCSVGTVGKETCIELVPPEEYRRCTRLDMQYLCALIQKLESDPVIRPQLNFFPNDSLYKIGGKLRYIEYHYQKAQRIHQISAVEVSDYISTVLERAKNGARLEELARSIASKDISIEEAFEFVTEMVDAQLLKSELEPSVVGGDTLTVLIKKLSSLKNVSDLPALCAIKEKLDEIDRNPIGTTKGLYADIVEQIKSLGVEYELRFLFQTDLFKPAETATISEEVCDDLRDLLLFLSALSQPVRHADLKNFKEAFSKRYEERTMPLAEVLDTELGLGYPYNVAGSSDVGQLIEDLILPHQAQESDPIFVSKRDALLLRKYVECISNGGDTIVLTDADFNLDFNKKDIPEELLDDTVSVLFNLISDLPEDRKIYIRSINNVVSASSLGRLCHLDAEMENLIRSIAEKENTHNPNVIIAEISHLPESRMGNIASRPLFRDFVIHYLSNSDVTPEQKIPLTDLLISVREDRLILSSQKYGKEVYPKLTCAHNHILSPIPFYRFLCDIQVQQASSSLHFSYGSVFSTFNYLPRLQYKNIILARQKWTIKKEEIKGSYKLNNLELLLFFESLMNTRRLSRYVLIVGTDKEMYIDLQNTDSLHILLDLVKMREEFSLEEFLFKADCAVVKDRQGSFTNEMVVVFHK